MCWNWSWDAKVICCQSGGASSDHITSPNCYNSWTYNGSCILEHKFNLIITHVPLVPPCHCNTQIVGVQLQRVTTWGPHTLEECCKNLIPLDISWLQEQELQEVRLFHYICPTWGIAVCAESILTPFICQTSILLTMTWVLPLLKRWTWARSFTAFIG